MARSFLINVCFSLIGITAMGGDGFSTSICGGGYPTGGYGGGAGVYPGAAQSAWPVYGGGQFGSPQQLGGGAPIYVTPQQQLSAGYGGAFQSPLPQYGLSVGGMGGLPAYGGGIMPQQTPGFIAGGPGGAMSLPATGTNTPEVRCFKVMPPDGRLEPIDPTTAAKELSALAAQRAQEMRNEIAAMERDCQERINEKRRLLDQALREAGATTPTTVQTGIPIPSVDAIPRATANVVAPVPTPR